MTAHETLLNDLINLLRDATNFHFHDFKAPGVIATPKIDLIDRLNSLVVCAKTGRYDDKPDEEDAKELREICDVAAIPEAVQKIIGLK